VARDAIDVLQGTLDLLILKTISGGRMHGYTVLARLRDASGDRLRVEDAAVYPALHRLEERGLIEAEWGLSENNRRAKFYRLTAAGRRTLQAEARSWNRYVEMVARVLAQEPA
jgi:PadR family transcriptional regulator PadR